MIGSIVGLIASLLSIVVGLLVTSHGQFISQQTQLQTIAVAPSSSMTSLGPIRPHI
jgi:hypothetical protein